MTKPTGHEEIVGEQLVHYDIEVQLGHDPFDLLVLLRQPGSPNAQVDHLVSRRARAGVEATLERRGPGLVFLERRTVCERITEGEDSDDVGAPMPEQTLDDTSLSMPMAP